jgi:hypothetical protein
MKRFSGGRGFNRAAKGPQDPRASAPEAKSLSKFAVILSEAARRFSTLSRRSWDVGPRRRRISLPLFCALALLGSAPFTLAQNPPSRPPGPPPTAKSSATVNLTGYWVSLIDDEWRWRMITPAKGDMSFVPLNPEGRRVANAWDPAKDEADGNACRAFGAAGIMHLPTRLHITWVDDNTLEIDTDAGMQKRLFHFGGSRETSANSEPSWQGESAATWEKQPQSTGFGGPRRTGESGPGAGAGSLQVITTHMKPGYLRKNGVPYSGDAVLTEFFDRIELDGTPYLVVTGIVEDPQYLTSRFITTEQFKQEPDASKWNPTPCKVPPPLAPFHPSGL